MTVFVDTSGIYAMLDADDHNHEVAGHYWSQALSAGDTLVTASSVLIETHALVQRRLGMAVLRRFQPDVVPILAIDWIDERTYMLGADIVLAHGQRTLSLVDCLSFVVMERRGIEDVFTFDPHFRDQGFKCRP